MNLNISVRSKDLLKLLTLANSTVEKRNIIPILNNFKLEAKNGVLNVTATDMCLSVVQEMPAHIKSEGAITVSSQIMLDIIKKITADEIHIQLVEDLLEIRTANCHFNLPTIHPKEFPTITNANDLQELEIDAKSFVTLLEDTRFSVSTEETRYNISGIYLHCKDNSNNLIAASTDGHRLSISSVILSHQLKDIGVILPKKTIGEIVRILTDNIYANTQIKISFSKNIILIRVNKLILSSKLIEATFPDYSSFIPKDNNNILKISSLQFASAIDRVDTVTMDKMRTVKISLSSKFIEVRAYHESTGEARERIMLSDGQYQGENMTIGFNPRYLLDIFSTIKKDHEISVSIKDATSPAIIKIKNTDSLFVVMPVRV